MNFTDIILITMILSGSGFLFYRSFFKKKGCSSCSVSDCPMKVLVSKKIMVK